jgi:hypothetical protein
MSLQLLHEIQAIADRYAEARIAYDKAYEKHDAEAKALHWERLIEAEAAFMLLYPQFTHKYADVKFNLENNMVVVWRRGAVGLQGLLTHFHGLPNNQNALAWITTKRGVFAEYVRNLMPLSQVI